MIILITKASYFASSDLSQDSISNLATMEFSPIPVFSAPTFSNAVDNSNASDIFVSYFVDIFKRKIQHWN